MSVPDTVLRLAFSDGRVLREVLGSSAIMSASVDVPSFMEKWRQRQLDAQLFSGDSVVYEKATRILRFLEAAIDSPVSSYTCVEKRISALYDHDNDVAVLVEVGPWQVTDRLS